MKILDVEQLAEADKVTIEKQKITSEELMERAATLVFDEIHSRLQGANVPIKIFCGIGNNGGDGLVIARLLLEKEYQVTTYVVNYSNKRSPDFMSNYNRLNEIGKSRPVLLKNKEDFPELQKTDIIIDAIFGIGINRPIEGWVAELVKEINASEGFVIAVDMPSGLFADKTPEEKEAVVKADLTFTFQTPKLVFFLPQTAEYVGKNQVLDIGLDKEFLHQAPARANLISKQEALNFYRPRKKFSHKGNFGHSLIIGGSYGKIGSISLTATAALRTGAGLVSIFSPKCGYEILQIVLPEAMVITDPGEKELKEINFEMEPDAICFGMGVGKSKSTIDAFKELLKKTEKSMVIDADGLNILSKEKDLINLVPKNSILTPHPKELQRLIGEWKDDFQKLEMAQEFTAKNNLILVIKGAHTVTVSGENLFINNTGNPGMATAGTGDALSGVITGLLSQAYEPLAAAVFGVYLHGKAGDFSAGERGYESMIAGDLIENIGSAYLDLFQKEETIKR